MKRITTLTGAIVLLAIGFILGFSASQQPKPPQIPQSSVVILPKEGTYAVARVLDGDTIELASGERVRYHGIDAPESGQRWSSQALTLNRSFVEEKTVRLELDRVTRDPYGRILAYVWVGNHMVNEALLREGYARYYAAKGEAVPKYRDRFEEAEREARGNHRGLWMDEWTKNR